MTDNYSRRNAIFSMATVGGAIAIGGAMVESSTANAQTSSAYYPPGNILNYGADPTGVQDSSAAINSAILALWNSNNGCAIYVPTGRYKISQPIIFKTKMKLYGDGFSSVIKYDFGPATIIPSISTLNLGAGAALSFPPMICNTSPIQWWAIEGIQFDGQNKDVYGAWFAAAYYGTIKNVYFLNTKQRPYTAVVSNFVNHNHVAFYGCDDGVVCWNCLSFSMDSVAFERLKGAYSFQWRSKTVAYGALDMRNIYLENSNSPDNRMNTVAFLGLGGSSIFGRTFLASNRIDNELQLVHLFDDGDEVVLDGISMKTKPAIGIDLGQIVRTSSDLKFYFGVGCIGNSISGYIKLTSVINQSGVAVYADTGSSSNGLLSSPIPAPNGSRPNFVTSLI
jgi:polygalacturonase